MQTLTIQDCMGNAAFYFVEPVENGSSLENSNCEAYRHKQKLKKAIAYLGKKWVLHKETEYKPCAFPHVLNDWLSRKNSCVSAE